MKIIVTGATGLVGAEVVREAIKNPQITAITAIVRSNLDLKDDKLKIITHQDFMNYDELKNEIKSADAMLWCLGISQTQVSKIEYEVITYDYTIAAAKAVQLFNPDCTFIFLSGEGADITEKSKTIFARVKGRAENELNKMQLKKLFIVRPAGIKPINKNPKTAFSNKLMIPFFPLFELLMPNFVISSVQLAKAMLHITLHSNENKLIKNIELKKIGSQN